MSRLLTLTRRELAAYFFSPLAYIVMTAYLFFTGFYFSFVFKEVLPGGSGQAAGVIFHICSLAAWLLTPFLTMRLLAEEKGRGTLEVLMTSPVTETQVVVSKYLSAFIFFMFLNLPTLVYLYLIRREVPAGGQFDYGPVCSGYIGLLLVGGVFISMGLFISSTTSSLLIAGLFSIFLNFIIWIVGNLKDRFQDENARKVVEFVGLYGHLDNFIKGVFSTQDFVYYLSFILLFVFLTIQVLESRRWR